MTGRLNLTLRPGESLTIGDVCVSYVGVMRHEAERVRVVEAPRDVPVLRRNAEPDGATLERAAPPERATVEVGYKPRSWPADRLLGKLGNCTDTLLGVECELLHPPRGPPTRWPRGR